MSDLKARLQRLIFNWNDRKRARYSAHVDGRAEEIKECIQDLAVLLVGEEPHKCPRCDSPSPHLHPAIQWEGEVQSCPDAFHRRVTNQNPAVGEEPATDPWHPIATAPKGIKALFWVVPKTADETYTDTSGTPIVAHNPPLISMGEFGWWSSLSKATHWMPLPAPPGAASPRVHQGEETK